MPVELIVSPGAILADALLSLPLNAASDDVSSRTPRVTLRRDAIPNLKAERALPAGTLRAARAAAEDHRQCVIDSPSKA